MLWWALPLFPYFYSDCPWPYCDHNQMNLPVDSDTGYFLLIQVKHIKFYYNFFQVRSASNPRPESLVYVSPAKRTKYSIQASQGPLSPQSILRNQLQLAKELGGVHSSNSGALADNMSVGGVEVKSEPMAILSSQEDVPSSGVNVQELMSSHEGDLASLSAAIPQGISPHFMFSPDPDGGATSVGPTSGPNGSNGPGGNFLFSIFCDFSVKMPRPVVFLWVCFSE